MQRRRAILGKRLGVDVDPLGHLDHSELHVEPDRLEHGEQRLHRLGGVRVDLDAPKQRDLVVDRHARGARLLEQGHRLIGVVRPDLEVRVVAVDAGHDELGRRHDVLGKDGADQGLPVDRQKEIWVRHVQGIYEIKERIKKEFPQVSLECCSGGGGRVDYGMLKYCELALVSDNHDPLTRLLIQEGYSYIFPAKTMGSWVTDVPSPLTNRSLPLKFMFHMAMTGAMGIQSNILEWSEQETEYAKEMIRLYKEIRPIIQQGHLYRLCSLRSDHIGAVQYVDQQSDHAVLFAFMWTNCACPAPVKNIFRWGAPRFVYKLFLQGLTPDKRYSVNGSPALRSGASLMNAGLEVELEGDGDSTFVRLEAVPTLKDWKVKSL